MRPLIPVPSKGQQLRATWGAQMTDRVNELCAMAPAGMLAREGFGGVGAQPLPRNYRDHAAPKVLWSFSCTEGENGERTGGWYNCRLQVGYTYFLGDDDIDGRDLCVDGESYVEIDVKNTPNAAEIKVAGSGENVPATDIVQSLLRIPIGTVSDGKLVGSAIDMPIVAYSYM